MNILITGAKGQLGSELIDILAAGKSDLGEIPLQYQGCDITAVDIDTADIADYSVVEKLMLKVKPDIVFNCAAMTNVDGCETDYEAALKGNAVGPRNLAVVADRIGAKLVHISTDYVFPGDGDKPYMEWDRCDPQTVYGKSKLLGEKYVAQFCRRYFIVRTAWLYGKTGKNFVRTMLSLGEKLSEVKVVNDQVGNPTNANDLAHQILKLSLSEEYGVYHCSGSGQCSWCELAAAVMSEAKLSCQVVACTSEEYPSKTPRPKFSALDNLTLNLVTGQSTRPWREALNSYILDIKGEK